MTDDQRVLVRRKVRPDIFQVALDPARPGQSKESPSVDPIDNYRSDRQTQFDTNDLEKVFLNNAATISNLFFKTKFRREPVRVNLGQ